MDSNKNELIKILDKYYLKLDKDLEYLTEKLFQMYKYDIVDTTNTDPIYHHSIAIYYEYVKKSYPEAVKYYLMAIENNNIDAMNNLANYYITVELNYPLAKKYYIMAINSGNSAAMNNIAYCYYTTVKKNMIKQLNIIWWQFNITIPVQCIIWHFIMRQLRIILFKLKNII